MSRAWRTWVAMWDLREHPRSMALIRVTLGLVVLWDLLQVGRLGLVEPLMGTAEAGGLSLTLRTPSPAPWAQLLPASPAAAWALYGGLVGSALLFTVGVMARPAMVLFALLSAQWEWMLPPASRGIESLIRIVLLILACSGSDRWLSVDAWRRTGSPWGDGAPVPAWPRHLVVVQLALMYFLAGVQKFGLDWSPAHGFSALYLILQDPMIANGDYRWVAAPPWYTLTQVGTAVTMAWEWSAPIVLLAYWYRFTADRPGRVRAWFNRWRIHWWWAAIGVGFHLAIAALLELGIFPAAMLCTYFAFVHPDELPSPAGLRARISATRSRRLPSNSAR